MNQNRIPESELIINDDGSIFHLHLKPKNISDKIIVVGDPGRVDTVSANFESKEFVKENREFKTVTGLYKGKRITVLSHGIGGGCIDIVATELDALANVDFNTRTPLPTHKTLNIVRLGTCGGLQPDTPIGTFVASEYSIGFDSLLNFYAGKESVCNADLEKKFKQHTNWSTNLGTPYAIPNSSDLLKQIAQRDMKRGITCSAGGFYAPQGRVIRAELAYPELNSCLQSFEYNGLHITNFEMEGAQLAGLSTILGHKAMTVCMVIANRFAKEADANYKNSIDKLITTVLERI